MQQTEAGGRSSPLTRFGGEKPNAALPQLIYKLKQTVCMIQVVTGPLQLVFSGANLAACSVVFTDASSISATRVEFAPLTVLSPFWCPSQSAGTLLPSSRCRLPPEHPGIPVSSGNPCSAGQCQRLPRPTPRHLQFGSTAEARGEQGQTLGHQNISRAQMMHLCPQRDSRHGLEEAQKHEEGSALPVPRNLDHESPWRSISWRISLCKAFGDALGQSVIKRAFCLNLWPPESVQQGWAEEQPLLRQRGCSWFLGWF